MNVQVLICLISIKFCLFLNFLFSIDECSDFPKFATIALTSAFSYEMVI